ATRINGYTPLFLAAQAGSAPAVAALLKAGADPRAVSSTGSTPLMLAAGAGSLEGVRLLIDAGAEIEARESARGQTALMFAAAYDRVEVVRELARRGAAVGATSKVIDLYALTSDEPPDGAAGPPRAAGAPRRASQVPGVHRAYTYTELIGYMGGMAPLHFAAREGHAAAVQALLEAGADIDQGRDGDRSTPLLIATLNGHFDLAKALLE